MYAFQSLTRIYYFILLCVCSALFPISSLANAPNQLAGYWSMEQSRWISEQEMEQRVQRELKRNIYKPSNSTLSTAPSQPTFSKNAGGGLSQTSQTIIRSMGYPSTFSTTSNYSLAAAKDALKGCVRSPACAGRALGVGAIYYEGIHAWKEVAGFFVDEYGNLLVEEPKRLDYLNQGSCKFGPYGPYPFQFFPSCEAAYDAFLAAYCTPTQSNCPTTLSYTSSGFGGWRIVRKGGSPSNSNHWITTMDLQPSNCPGNKIGNVDFYGCKSLTEKEKVPASLPAVDASIASSYNPEPSDAPFVLLSGNPDSLTLSTPSSVDLPSTTTTSTNSLGETETTVANSTINYEVTNNNTSNPTINSTLVENKTVYNDYGTVINTSTTTTTSEGVQGETSSPFEFELPSFCSWAESLCDWLNWTKEPLDEQEPDLAVLISEFEPDDGGYSSGIGSGSCPAPMSLNLGIIQQTVEVSYQPFCDFLAMIRPLVIAGAWLISAFMYVGVLRRG